MSSRFLALAATLALPTAAAVAQSAQAPTLKLKLSRTAKSNSGLTVGATFGTDASGKARILTATKMSLPKGTVFNTKAVARCTASFDQVSAAPGGAKDVCPPASKIGSATAAAILGDGTTPTDFTGSVWNFAAGPLVELDIGTTPAYFISSTLKANSVLFDLSNAPSLNAHATKVSLKIAKAGTRSKPFLRTPRSCPKGRWTASELNTFSDGTTATAKTTVPCKRTKT
jgi:hypothetical protein